MQHSFQALKRFFAGLSVALLIAAGSAVSAANEFPPSIPLSGLDGADGTRFDGVAAGDNAGYAVSASGDVNGDGLSDLIIGARSANSNSSDSGSAYVVFGTPSGLPASLGLGLLNGSNGFEIIGESGSDLFGIAVATGDINGDGFGDVIVAAEQAGTIFGAGAVYVIFGKASGFNADVATFGMAARTGFRIEGNASGDFTGSSVAAGDVNGDGIDDVIIGVRSADFSGSNAGAAYVLFGKATRFDKVIAITSLTGKVGFRLDGAVADNGAGTAVAAGDVNGDGIDDIMVGANGAAPDGEFSGSAYVMFGKKAAFASSSNLGLLNGTTGFRVDGSGAFSQTGSSVSPAGDVNGDGTGDMLVGSLNSVPHGAALIFGHKSTFPASIGVAVLDGTVGVKFTTGEAFLGTSVAAAGDVNGDGFDDLIAGAQFDGVNDPGAGYVVFGKAAPFAASFDLATLDGTNGFKLPGAADQDQAGLSVSGNGDFNGDGFADVAVGSFFANSPGVDSGAASIIYGRAPDAAVARTGSNASQSISGGSLADTITALTGNDVLEGRGNDDELNGGGGSDTASYRYAPSGLTADLLNAGNNTGHANGDTYNAIENLAGSAFGDTLSGNEVANVITGGGGPDGLRGRGGGDIFRYESVADSPAGSGRDKIADFNAGTSATAIDKIDLSAIDAKTGPRNNTFIYIAGAAFSGTAGELRAKVSGTNIVVSGDVDGDAVADIEIVLENFTSLAALTAADFIR